RRPVGPRVGLECVRPQLVIRSLRNSTGTSGKQDGIGGSRLAHEPGNPDLLGPRVYLGSLRFSVRCMVAFTGDWLVLTSTTPRSNDASQQSTASSTRGRPD